ncbi:hypothetical protein C8F01DRAFT_1154657, partial [Mycena amicta]
PVGPVCGTYRKDGRTFAVNRGDPTFVVDTPLPAPHNPELKSVDRDVTRPSYLTPVDAHLMFIPRQNPWTGPIFSFLDHTAESFPIVQFSPKNFGLCPNERRKWRTLESTLRAFCWTMATMVNLEGLVLSPPVAPPRQYGYASTFPSEEIAHRTIWRLRDDLLPLLGTVSLAFWCIRLAGASPEYDGSWQTELVKRSGLDLGWVAALEGSVVNDWSVPRVGGIFDIAYEDPCNRETFFKPSSFDRLVCSLIEATVDQETPLDLPMYFHWGSKHHEYPFLPSFLEEIDFIVPNPRLDAFMESSPGATKFHSWQACRLDDGVHYFPFEEIVILHSPAPEDGRALAMSMDVEASEPEPPALGSCKVPLQTAEEVDDPMEEVWELELVGMISSNNSADEADLKNLSVTEAELVEIGELQALSFPPLYFIAAQLPYEGLDVFLKRRGDENQRVAAAETPQAYDQRHMREHIANRLNTANPPPHDMDDAMVFVWTPTQGSLVRTPVRHGVLDVWNSFLPNQRSYDSFHHEWDLSDALQLHSPSLAVDVIVNDCQEPADRQATVHFSAPSTSSSDSAAEHPPSNAPPSAAVVDVDIFERAFLHFGYVKPSSDHEVPELKPFAPHHVAILLGSSRLRYPSKKVEQELHLLQFFRRLSTASSLKDIEPIWSDFWNPTSCLHSELPFKLERLTLYRFSNGVIPKNPNTVYMMTDKHPELTNVGKTCLLLRSPATVLQILRQRWGPSVHDIARHLFNWGIRFELALCASRLPTSSMPQSAEDSSLPDEKQNPPAENDSGLTPGRRCEYGQYLDRLKSLILETPRGRIALQAGGLVGRLARMVAPSPDRDVIGDLDETILETGHCLWDRVSPYAYWTGSLSGDDLSLIIGTSWEDISHAWSGRTKTTNPSWWPHPNTFLTSTLFPEWWSQRCEDWFVRHHNAVLGGVVKEKRLDQWKEAQGLKPEKTVVKLRKNYEKLADEFLAYLLPQQPCIPPPA